MMRRDQMRLNFLILFSIVSDNKPTLKQLRPKRKKGNLLVPRTGKLRGRSDVV